MRLNFDGALRREQVRAAVEMRSEFDAVLIYLATLGQAEDLVAAAVGEDRLLPADELVEAATASDELVSRPEHQVIGVSENDAGADVFKVLRSQGLYRTLG